VKLSIEAVKDLWRQAAQDRAVRWSLTIFIMLRVSLSGLAIVVISLQPLPEGNHESEVLSRGLEPVSTRAEQLLVEVWQRWDVLNYQRIATHGYTDNQSSVFPPLLPALARVLGTLLGDNYLLSAMLISNLSFLLALVYFYKLTRLDYGDAAARRATFYLSIFPTAFFLMIPYSESLFLLLVMLFFYAVRHQRWVAASAAAGLASLTRVQGVVLIVPLGYEWLRHTGLGPRRVGRLLLLTLPVLLPPAAFVLARHFAGYPPLGAVLETEWHTTIGIPWRNFVNLVSLFTSRRASGNNIVNAAIVLPFLLVTLASLLRVRASYSLYTAATLVVVLGTVHTRTPLVNLPRHVLLLFPTFMFIATRAKRPAVHRAVVYPSTALLILLTCMFVQWFWVS